MAYNAEINMDNVDINVDINVEINVDDVDINVNQQDD